jgi:hypothetical protein
MLSHNSYLLGWLCCLKIRTCWTDYAASQFVYTELIMLFHSSYLLGWYAVSQFITVGLIILSHSSYLLDWLRCLKIRNCWSDYAVSQFVYIGMIMLSHSSNLLDWFYWCFAMFAGGYHILLFGNEIHGRSAQQQRVPFHFNVIIRHNFLLHRQPISSASRPCSKLPFSTGLKSIFSI